jgi:hypothetical protein
MFHTTRNENVSEILRKLKPKVWLYVSHDYRLFSIKEELINIFPTLVPRAIRPGIRRIQQAGWEKGGHRDNTYTRMGIQKQNNRLKKNK